MSKLFQVIWRVLRSVIAAFVTCFVAYGVCWLLNGFSGQALKWLESVWQFVVRERVWLVVFVAILTIGAIIAEYVSTKIKRRRPVSNKEKNTAK